ncbi:MAG: hypothetical protein ACR2NY_00920 [Alphaproteobacteria bacterium]
MAIKKKIKSTTNKLKRNKSKKRSMGKKNFKKFHSFFKTIQIPINLENLHKTNYEIKNLVNSYLIAIIVLMFLSIACFGIYNWFWFLFFTNEPTFPFIQGASWIDEERVYIIYRVSSYAMSFIISYVIIEFYDFIKSIRNNNKLNRDIIHYNPLVHIIKYYIAIPSFALFFLTGGMIAGNPFFIWFGIGLMVMFFMLIALDEDYFSYLKQFTQFFINTIAVIGIYYYCKSIIIFFIAYLKNTKSDYLDEILISGVARSEEIFSSMIGVLVFSLTSLLFKNIDSIFGQDQKKIRYDEMMERRNRFRREMMEGGPRFRREMMEKEPRFRREMMERERRLRRKRERRINIENNK